MRTMKLTMFSIVAVVSMAALACSVEEMPRIDSTQISSYIKNEDDTGLWKFDETLSDLSGIDVELVQHLSMNPESMPSDESVTQAIELSRQGKNALITFLYSRLLKSKDSNDTDLAKKLIQQAASTESEIALYNRALLKESGVWNAGVDDCDIYSDYSLAAKKGFPLAMTLEAKFYLNGRCVEKDGKKAGDLLKAAAGLDDAQAERLLGEILIILGKNQEDFALAESYLRESISHGDIKAKHALARYLVDKDSDKYASEIAELLKSSIQDKNADSMELLARFIFLNPDLPIGFRESLAEFVIGFENDERADLKYAKGVVFNIDDLKFYDPNKAMGYYVEAYLLGDKKTGLRVLQMSLDGHAAGLTDCELLDIAEALPPEKEDQKQKYLERADLQCEKQQ